MTLPAIAVTMGDAAGVGPEICIRAIADHRLRGACFPLVIGSADVLDLAADKLGLPRIPHHPAPADFLAGRRMPAAGPCIIDLGGLSAQDWSPGHSTPACGRAAFNYFTSAVRLAQNGSLDAIATAPIHKESLHAAGIDFPGHTEIIEHLTGATGAVMMLYSPRITVSLATTHIALRDVPAALTRARIEHVIRTTHEAMSRILGRAPRLAVLALNCHAGEGGMFGDEEQRLIRPALDAARAAGLDVAGPLPPDTAFTPGTLQSFDAHVCMFHDQGLIPFKTLSFEDGVNVTLAVPIVRTSVDHGTAFDIAWQGKASHASLVAAILLAARLASKPA